MNIKIICIKWGNHKYSNDYVEKLYRGIKQNTSVEFSFVCYIDKKFKTKNNIEFQPLPLNLNTWFNKVGLYNQELHKGFDQVFYFDLDTIVWGNIDHILTSSYDFILLRDFYRKSGFGSGLMSWRPPAVNHMWKNFTCTYKNRFGDQGWCEEQYSTADIWQKEFPNEIISYKVHIRDKKLKQPPKDAKIICFHGRPSPHEAKDKWVKENWI